MKKLFLVFSILTASITVMGQQPIPVKPRILISTDIGGTDPDDNQSMAHFLMYSEMFETEGLVSSPSYGHGSKQNLLDMIDLYEKDLPKLKKHIKGFPSPDALRAICKQGRQGAAPFKGYTTATEGSDWIIKCARKESTRPLWILVWGGLDDLAQALHDAPDIQNKIRVYWIGGPNKKWSTNSYVYIVENFPNLWFIEANASYRGFITNDKQPGKFNKDYYDECIRGAGHLGKDYIKYYDGKVKMGDTPSLLYMMDGDPNNPQKESWGGSFEKFTHSPRVIFNRSTTLKDTVPVYQKAIEAYERIQAGEDFAAVGKELKDADKENVGYEYVHCLLPMQTVKAFENVAYSLPVGSVSLPVRTTMGFHIIKIHSRRRNPGLVRVAHVLIPFEKDSVKFGEAETLARAEEVYRKAKDGADFAMLAKEYSSDAGSAKRGGELPAFGVGEMVEPFEVAAFALNTPGELSRPVKTRFGYHIIKLIEKKGIPSFDDKKKAWSRQMAQGERNFEYYGAFDERKKSTDIASIPRLMPNYKLCATTIFRPILLSTRRRKT